jgi:hypothetical protein
MANANTAHSKELRQQTATERRKAIKNDGGKDLSNVLLEKEDVRKLTFLCNWFGSGNKAANQTEVIKKLIEAEYRKHAYKPLFDTEMGYQYAGNDKPCVFCKGTGDVEGECCPICNGTGIQIDNTPF